jgi:hypothetical protein
MIFPPSNFSPKKILLQIEQTYLPDHTYRQIGDISPQKREKKNEKKRFD